MNSSTAGLRTMGIASGDTLAKLLSSTSDPQSAIEGFQQENSVKLDSLAPALPLLDLHKVYRSQFHEYVVKSLRSTLLKRIEVLSVGIREADKLNTADSNDKTKTMGTDTQKSQATAQKEKNLSYLIEILKLSFPLVQLDTVRPVIMSLIRALGMHTPEEYLRKLALEPVLYKACSIEIKQLVWQKDSKLFHTELEPLVKNVLRMRNTQLGVFDAANLSFKENYLLKNNSTIMKGSRPGADTVEKIAKMCSSSQDLYNSCTEYLRLRFRETKCLHYCTLRAEIIMYLHDMDSVHTRDDASQKTQRTVRKNESVLIQDAKPHKVAWCADALMRNMNTQTTNPEIELRRIKELEQAIANAVEPCMFYRNEDVLERRALYDCFMILADPFFVNNCVLWTLVKKLHTMVMKGLSKEEINSKLLRSIDQNLSQPQQTVVTFVNILHLSTMAFEENLQFYNDKTRKHFTSTLIANILPLVQAITVELTISKFGKEVKKEFPDKMSESNEAFNAFLEEKGLPKIPEVDDSVFDKAMEQLKKRVLPRELPLQPTRHPSCELRVTVLILRHYMLYCMKFGHFKVVKSVGKLLYSFHDVNYGPTISNVTVSDAFYLQYLCSFLIFSSFRNQFKRDPQILPAIINTMCYRAPDPLPAGSSSKQRKAANKAGFYDRLCQAEIVLGLVNVLGEELITDNASRKRIWKKLAPPSVTAAPVPTGIGMETMDRWQQRWEKWEEICKKSENIGELDREKLKKAKIKLPEKEKVTPDSPVKPKFKSDKKKDKYDKSKKGTSSRSDKSDRKKRSKNIDDVPSEEKSQRQAKLKELDESSDGRRGNKRGNARKRKILTEGSTEENTASSQGDEGSQDEPKSESSGSGAIAIRKKTRKSASKVSKYTEDNERAIENDDFAMKVDSEGAERRAPRLRIKLRPK